MLSLGDFVFGRAVTVGRYGRVTALPPLLLDPDSIAFLPFRFGERHVAVTRPTEASAA
jgi:hypothetical protein